MKRYAKSFAEMIPCRNGAWTTYQQAEKAVRTAANSKLSVVLKYLQENGISENFPILVHDIKELKVK
jgi:hypothetical protein